MNDKLQDQITALLEKTLSGVDASTNFLQGEIPLYIQELLLWHSVHGFSMFLIGIILSVIFLYLFFFKYKPFIAQQNDNGAFDDDCFFLLFFGCATTGLLIAITQLIFGNLTWLQIWISPRVFLVEYAAKLAG